MSITILIFRRVFNHFQVFVFFSPRTHKLTHTSTVVQDGRGGWNLPPLLVFVLFRQSEINLHWLDSPELALQDGTISFAYDVKWRHWTLHLGFFYFLKSQEITEINTKSSHNAYKMYKFTSFLNLTKKTGKTHRNISKTWILARPTWNLMAAMATSSMMDTQMTYQSFRREWRNSNWKFHRLPKFWKKKLMGVGVASTPLWRPRVKKDNQSDFKTRPVKLFTASLKKKRAKQARSMRGWGCGGEQSEPNEE